MHQKQKKHLISRLKRFHGLYGFYGLYRFALTRETPLMRAKRAIREISFITAIVVPVKLLGALDSILQSL